ncbi:MAG: hypothetical protein NTX61_09615 [Bacteroidetes bacterium]|nr:hypothetical protein [Bacteroidota bacterium]
MQLFRKFSPVKPGSVYLFSGIVLFLTALLSVGYYHPDEHFQILEFAGYKLNLTDKINLPWEFYRQMRPSIQPVLVIIVYKIFGLFGMVNPFIVATFLRILTAGISFISMWLIYQAYAKDVKIDILKNWFLLLSFFLWFAISNNVRYSSETWSGNLFIMAYALMLMENRSDKWIYLLTGLLFGLSFIVRYQAGFLVAGLILWSVFVKKERFISLFLMFLGILIAVGLGILSDRWFYGEWTLTAWNYLEQNILLDKMSGFGTQPWWFYITDVFIRGIPPFSLVYIFSFLILFLFHRKDPLTWTILPFVVLHFFLGHKETRFLFPIVGFLPIIIVKSIETICDKWKPGILEISGIKLFAATFWITNLLLLFYGTVNPADGQVNLYKKIFQEYSTPTTLYFINEDPYYRAKKIGFYKRQNLTIQKLDSNNEMTFNSKGLCLVAAKNKKLINLRHPSKLIYTTYPDWIYHFNLNHWMERTKCWYLYEVREEPMKNEK